MLKYLPVLLICATAGADTLEVPAGFPTIQAAIDAAAPGDTVKIAPGTYAENPVIRKALTIEGSGAGQTVIENRYQQGECLRVLETDGVAIRGVTLRQSNVDNLDKHRKLFPDVLYIESAQVVARECEMGPSAGCGVAVKGESKVEVLNSRVHDNPQWGILWTEGTGSARFEGNTITTNTSGGIYIRDGTAVVDVTNNEISGCKFAVGFEGEGIKGVIKENRVRDCKTSGIFVQQQANADMLGNTVEDIEEYGLAFCSGGRGRADGNHIRGTAKPGICIFLWGAQAELVDNHIQEAAGGISVQTGCEAVIRNNRIEDDTLSGITVLQWKAKATVEGNEVRNAGKHGIWISAGSEATVQHNTVKGSTGYGILASDEGTKASILENTVEDSGEENVAEIPGLPYRMQEQVDYGQGGYMLQQNAFAAMEELAAALRTYRSRWDQGGWQLPYFYNSFENGPPTLRVATRKVYMEKLREWQLASPDAAEPLILQAIAHKLYGWNSRGSGYASEVTEEGRRVFREELDQARVCLQQAKILNPNDPHIYSELLVCAAALSFPRAEFDAILAEGQSVEFLYYPLVQSAVNYLLPRWHGNELSIESLARDWSEANGPDDNDRAYATVALACMFWEPIDDATSFHLEWDRIRAGLDALQSDFSDPAWHQNSKALWACVYEDQPVASETFQAIGQEWDPYVWDDYEEFRQWKQWALGKTPRPEPEATFDYGGTTVIEAPIEFTPEKMRTAAFVFLVPLVGFVLLLVLGLAVMIVVSRHKSRRRE